MAVALLALSLMAAACSSDTAEEAAQAPASDGEGGQAAAATGGTGKMLDTPEYKVAQEFEMTMEVTSSVFSRIRRIPIEFTCTDNYWYPEAGFAPRYGEDKSPPLAWTAGPEGTKSYAIIADDPDAVEYDPGVISPRVHWTIWNIPPDVIELVEHVPTTTEVLSIGPNTRQGVNDYLQTGWSGPCPPPNIISIYSRDDHPGGGKTTQYPHAYAFTVYALDTELELGADATKNDLLEAMDGHILSAGRMTGEYINKKLYK
jgi:Raf kinase inhibitor-like YbhB/YbcL family protein